MSVPNEPAVESAGMAGHLVLVLDGALPAEAQQACAVSAAALAETTGMPVSVATVPIARLDALRDALSRDAEARRREYAPSPRPAAAPMSSAPFVWRQDGRPDWGSMWTSFCELALYGGPPQRGPASALRAPGGPPALTDDEMLGEMRRGIWETTGLFVESPSPGWIAVTCESRAMAEWLKSSGLIPG